MASPTGYEREPEGAQPPLDSPDYKSTRLRHPKQPLVYLPHAVTEVTGPQLGPDRVGELDADLTRQHAREPMGERIIVSGRVLDTAGRPLPGTLVEIWQANAAGRYLHARDNWPAQIDPNFSGAGRCLTDDEGRYTFTTIKPGPYPWGNHHNAWRPAHIHFSLFGTNFLTRLITQMYFPGDPLLPLDPIYNSIPDQAARRRLVSAHDPELSQAEYALGYRFDVVLRGRGSTPFEGPR